MAEQEENKEDGIEQEGFGEDQAEAGDLSVQLVKALEKNRELEDKLLRLAAEQDNFRKRMQSQKTSFLDGSIFG